MKIAVNGPQVERVLGALMAAFEGNKYPYYLDRARVPQDHRHLPSNLPLGGLEHARFLWHVCYYMRGGIRSNTAVRLLAKLYEDFPNLFDFEVGAELDPAFFSLLLNLYGLGYKHSEVAEIWVENAKRMVERWEGDPRQIFSGVRTYEEAVRRIKNDQRGGGFKGFQEKMVSMITYYLMDEELITTFNFPVPVDFHVLRITIATEMLLFPDISPGENVFCDETKAAVRNLYFDYGARHGINPLRLCDAVWLLSMVLCGEQPGNIVLMPDGRNARMGRRTRLVPLEIDLDSESQRWRYARACGSCVLNASCRYNVPSAYYYKWGQLLYSLRRHFPPPPEIARPNTHPPDEQLMLDI